MASRSQLMTWTLCTLSLLPATLKANDYILPVSPDDICDYVLNAQEEVASTEAVICAVPAFEKSYENTMYPWNSLGNDILEDFSVLTYLAQGKFPAPHIASQSIQELQGFLYYAVILNHDMQMNMMSYARNLLFSDVPPNPYENHMISCVLGSMNEVSATWIPQEIEELADLQLKYRSVEKTPFLYLLGQADDKFLSDEQTSFSVFNLNTCFVPGIMSFMHGGVAPWELRVRPLADEILAVDADVVCLQEVFTEDASLALFEALKSNYGHFYVAIGPRPLGFSPSTFGLPSGLFVASKFPIANPQFTRFEATGYQMNYGVFDFTIYNGLLPLGHIYNVHLQSLNEEGFPDIRAQEMAELIEKIEADALIESDITLPRLVCGDFNISWGSGEPGEELILSYFYDSYNAGRTWFKAGEQTCTDYFSDLYFNAIGYPQPIGSNLQIIDYALLSNFSEGCSIETILVPMNNLGDPDNAISDHNGLLTNLR